MTDFIIETFLWCEQNDRYEAKVTGSRGETYSVTYGPQNPGPFTHNWDCTCPAQRFSRLKPCKHIEALLDKKCDHGWEASCGSPSDDWVDGKCPECGSPAVPVRVAV